MLLIVDGGGALDVASQHDLFHVGGLLEDHGANLLNLWWRVGYVLNVDFRVGSQEAVGEPQKGEAEVGRASLCEPVQKQRYDTLLLHESLNHFLRDFEGNPQLEPVNNDVFELGLWVNLSKSRV